MQYHAARHAQHIYAAHHIRAVRPKQAEKFENYSEEYSSFTFASLLQILIGNQSGKAKKTVK